MVNIRVSETEAAEKVCIYGKPAAFWVYPREGTWTTRKYQEILDLCEADPILNGVYSAACCEGGFAWPGNEESSKLWESQTGHLKYSGRMYDRQIRTYGTNTPHTERMALSSIPIPVSKTMFEKFGGIPALYLRAKCCPNFEMVVRLMSIFRNCRHTILATNGFKVIDNVAQLKQGKHYLITKREIPRS